MFGSKEPTPEETWYMLRASNVQSVLKHFIRFPQTTQLPLRTDACEQIAYFHLLTLSKHIYFYFALWEAYIAFLQNWGQGDTQENTQ